MKKQEQQYWEVFFIKLSSEKSWDCVKSGAMGKQLKNSYQQAVWAASNNE